MDCVADIRELCAELPLSQETFPFGMSALVFKVSGKMYALLDIQAEPLQMSLKVLPERAEALRLEYPAITAGYHLNKRHWITVVLEGVPSELAHELLTASYALVVQGLTRAQRAELSRNEVG